MIYSALSICVLFILVIQLINGAQFLNINFLLVLFTAEAAAAVLLTEIFPLTSIYASLLSHKLDFSFVVLNLIYLLGEYAPLISSFISTQFLILNLDVLFDALSNKFAIFGIPLLYYYTNLNSSIIYCLSYGDMYIFNVNINS